MTPYKFFQTVICSFKMYIETRQSTAQIILMSEWMVRHYRAAQAGTQPSGTQNVRNKDTDNFLVIT
jgi:hypothetical protein